MKYKIKNIFEKYLHLCKFISIQTLWIDWEVLSKQCPTMFGPRTSNYDL